METIFRNCQIALELSTTIPFKEKQKIRKSITDNGGTVSFVLNKKVRKYFCFVYLLLEWRAANQP